MMWKKYPGHTKSGRLTLAAPLPCTRTQQAAMSLAARKDDPEVEVRREDQEQINEFGRLNNRLIEIREDKGILKVRQHHCKT